MEDHFGLTKQNLQTANCEVKKMTKLLKFAEEEARKTKDDLTQQLAICLKTHVFSS